MALLDVNALVALAWDSHVHHVAMRAWFETNGSAGWATCSVTESGFVRVSSNPIVLPSAMLTVARRRGVRLVTFDASIFAIGDGNDVEILTAL